MNAMILTAAAASSNFNVDSKEKELGLFLKIETSSVITPVCSHFVLLNTLDQGVNRRVSAVHVIISRFVRLQQLQTAK